MSGEVLPGGPEVAHGGEFAPTTHGTDPVGSAPRVLTRRRGRGGAHGLEFLLGPFKLSGLDQSFFRGPAQLDQDLHVEGGVIEPVLRQGALGPVDGGVFLGEREPQELLSHGCQSDLSQAQQSAAQLAGLPLHRPQAQAVEVDAAEGVINAGQ